jgi:hypothetical protein
MKTRTFRRELTSVLNRYSKENGSNTPDFLLADYLIECIKTFDKVTRHREQWYSSVFKPFKSAEDAANDINYNNECARKTLGVVQKITADDLLMPKKK